MAARASRQSTAPRNARLVRSSATSTAIAGFYLGSSTDVLVTLGVCAAVALLPAPKLRPRAMDWCLPAVAASGVPSLLCSQYRANGTRTFWAILLSVMVYYAVRLLLRAAPQVAVLSGLLGLGGVWLASTGLLQFQTHVRELTGAGLTDLVAFRSRLMTPPAQWVLGEWLTVLLLALPFACVLAAWLWQTALRWLAAVALAPALAIAATLSLSCSRAVFWAMVVFCFTACGFMAAGRIVRPKAASILLASALAALALILAAECALYPGLFEAYAGRHASQVRSTEGRIGIWKRSADLIRAHPLWGVGSSNAALALTSTADQEDTAGFASRTFSLPVQVLVEKGIIVFLLYSVFLVLLGRECVLTLRSAAPPAARAMACCFAAGLVAVLVRELAYSSLFEHTVTLTLAAILAALVVGPDGEEKAGNGAVVASKAIRSRRPGQPGLAGSAKKTGDTPAVVRKAGDLTRPARSVPGFLRGNRSLKAVALAVAALVLVLHFVMADYDEADARLRSFYSQMLAADFAGARRSIDDAIRLWPANARYYTWRGYAISQKLPSQCARCLNTPMSPADRQAASEAIADYRRALDLNARDAVARHNLAWLGHLLGDDAAAARDWREATVIDPGNAVFHLSYGMFLDETAGPEAAEAQYETAIDLSPAILDSPFFARYRARFPQAAGSMVAHCVAKLESRLRGENDPILEARLGKLYQVTGNQARAAALLQDAARDLPNLPRVWLNLGEPQESQGDTAAALSCYRKARVIDAGLAGPWLHMGEISLRAGQGAAAADYLRSAVQRWERVNPITAAHNNRLYNGPAQRIDDLLPTTLVWYTTPCEASRAWGALAELFPENRTYAARSGTCEALPNPHLCDRLEGPL